MLFLFLAQSSSHLGHPQVPDGIKRSVSTALRAAASHDSLLTPITLVTRYTLSGMASSDRFTLDEPQASAVAILFPLALIHAFR